METLGKKHMQLQMKKINVYIASECIFNARRQLTVKLVLRNSYEKHKRVYP